jgi:hypothetical protein
VHNAAANISNSSSTSTSSSSSGTSSSSDASSDATAAAANWAVRHRTDVLTQRAAKFNSWQASHLFILQVLEHVNFKYMNMLCSNFKNLSMHSTLLFFSFAKRSDSVACSAHGTAARIARMRTVAGNAM